MVPLDPQVCIDLQKIVKISKKYIAYPLWVSHKSSTALMYNCDEQSTIGSIPKKGVSTDRRVSVWNIIHTFIHISHNFNYRIALNFGFPSCVSVCVSNWILVVEFGCCLPELFQSEWESVRRIPTVSPCLIRSGSRPVYFHSASCLRGHRCMTSQQMIR